MQFLKKIIQNLGGQTAKPSPSSWSLPEHLRIYALGDIHGRADLLATRLEEIYADSATYHGTVLQVFLGDYIDRGPDSLKVLQLLTAPPRQNHKRVCLKGNHEEAMLSMLDNPDLMETWAQFGATDALLSFGLDPNLIFLPEQRHSLAQKIHERLAAPQNLLSFLANLRDFFEIGDYYFVHAGIQPGRPLDKQTNQDRLWIRDAFLAYTKPHPKMIVHGHTPKEQVEFCSNRINLDTGAYATGVLSCLVLEGSSTRLL